MHGQKGESMRRSALAALGIVLLVGGCGGALMAVNPQVTYFTATNLRARGTVIVSTNRWDFVDVLPACSPVNVEFVGSREIRFVANGQRYRYRIHRTSGQNGVGHFEQLFLNQPCDPNALAPADASGVQAAQPQLGMTRQGVVMALGYPADHRTPDLNASPWTYWGEAGTVRLHFEGDALVRIEGSANEPAVVAAHGAPEPEMPVANTAGAAQVLPPQTGPGSPVGTPQPSYSGATTVVPDANGYPVRIPAEALGAPCAPDGSCYAPLVCIAGSCQVNQ